MRRCAWCARPLSRWEERNGRTACAPCRLKHPMPRRAGAWGPWVAGVGAALALAAMAWLAWYWS